MQDKVIKECKHCENLSTYNAGCCSLKLRGIKCQFVGTKEYWISKCGKLTKQLKQIEQEKEEQLQQFGQKYLEWENTFIELQQKKIECEQPQTLIVNLCEPLECSREYLYKSVVELKETIENQRICMQKNGISAQLKRFEWYQKRVDELEADKITKDKLRTELNYQCSVVERLKEECDNCGYDVDKKTLSKENTKLLSDKQMLVEALENGMDVLQKANKVTVENWQYRDELDALWVLFNQTLEKLKGAE
jgi:hypothetical protein